MWLHSGVGLGADRQQTTDSALFRLCVVGGSFCPIRAWSTQLLSETGCCYLRCHNPLATAKVLLWQPLHTQRLPLPGKGLRAAQGRSRLRGTRRHRGCRVPRRTPHSLTTGPGPSAQELLSNSFSHLKREGRFDKMGKHTFAFLHEKSTHNSHFPFAWLFSRSTKMLNKQLLGGGSLQL